MGSQKYYPRLKYYAQSFLTGQLGSNQNKIKTLYCNDEPVKLAARQCTPYEMGVVARYVNITIFSNVKNYWNMYNKTTIQNQQLSLFVSWGDNLLKTMGYNVIMNGIQTLPCAYFTAGPEAHLDNISKLFYTQNAAFARLCQSTICCKK